jgi:hypothetical protein
MPPETGGRLTQDLPLGYLQCGDDRIGAGRGVARAKDIQGTPTQSHSSPSIQAYEGTTHATPSTQWATQVPPPLESAGYVTKFALHKALKSIESGRLTF